MNSNFLFWVFCYSTFKGKIKLRKTCNIFYKFEINNLYNICNFTKFKLNSQFKFDNFPNITCLNLSDFETCHYINLNNFKKLQKLNISNSSIADFGISSLNLTYLALSGNSNITNISFLTNLKILVARDSFFFNYSDFYYLKHLQFLDLNGNNDLETNIPSIHSLIWLDVSYIKNMPKNLINNPNLQVLKIDGCCQSISLNHLTGLKKLHANYSKLQNSDIMKINPYELFINETDIYDINHMTNLTTLYADNSALNDNSISKINPIEMSINDVETISKISHMTRLKILEIAGFSAVNMNELETLDLVELNIWNNLKITNVEKLSSLRKLYYNHEVAGFEDIKKKIDYKFYL